MVMSPSPPCKLSRELDVESKTARGRTGEASSSSEDSECFLFIEAENQGWRRGSCVNVDIMALVLLLVVEFLAVLLSF